MKYTKEQYIADAMIIWEQQGTKEMLLFLAGMIVFFIVLAPLLKWFDKKVKSTMDGIVEVNYLGIKARGAIGSHARVMISTLFFGTGLGFLTAFTEKPVLYHHFKVRYENGKTTTFELKETDIWYKELVGYVQNGIPVNKTNALDNSGVDWNEQAVKSAKEYLELGSISRKKLIENLIDDGFTPEQAEYAAKDIER